MCELRGNKSFYRKCSCRECFIYNLTDAAVDMEEGVLDEYCRSYQDRCKSLKYENREREFGKSISKSHGGSY